LLDYFAFVFIIQIDPEQNNISTLLHWELGSTVHFGSVFIVLSSRCGCAVVLSLFWVNKDFQTSVSDWSSKQNGNNGNHFHFQLLQQASLLQACKLLNYRCKKFSENEFGSTKQTLRKQIEYKYVV